MAVGDIVMGRIVASYGVHGLLKVLPYTAEKETLLEHKQWSLVDREGVVRSYPLKEGRVHGEFLVVALEGVAVREAAAALRGMLVTAPRTALPKLAKGEFYFVDLVGLNVVNREDEALGIVNAVQEYGAQPVLHVTPSGPDAAGKTVELLIPFVGAHIDSVDLDARCIKVDWWRD